MVERTDMFWYRSNLETIFVYGILSAVERTDMFWYRSNLENKSVYCMIYGVWLKEQICSGIDLTWRIYLCTVGIRVVVEGTDMFWYRSNLENISVYCRNTGCG